MATSLNGNNIQYPDNTQQFTKSPLVKTRYTSSPNTNLSLPTWSSETDASQVIDMGIPQNGTNWYRCEYYSVRDDSGGNGNDETMRLTSGGNIGIGSTNPSSLLTVGARPKATVTAATVLISPASGNASIQLRGSSPTLEFDGTGGGNGRIFTDGADLAISNGTLDGAMEEMFGDKNTSANLNIDSKPLPRVVALPACCYFPVSYTHLTLPTKRIV